MSEGVQSRQIGLLVISIGVLLVLGVLSRWPWVVEQFYSQAAFPMLTRIPGFLFGWVPFSVTGILLILGPAGFLWWAARSVRAWRKAGRTGPRIIAGIGLGVLTATSVFGAWAYLFWGLNYARPTAVERFHWDAVVPADTGEAREELVRLSRDAIRLTNEAYSDAFGARDIGTPSQSEGPGAMDAGIEAGFEAVARQLELPNPIGESFSPAKGILGSAIAARLGISGFYSPWTGEAHFNTLIPASSLPHTIAHEKSHQRGIASEDEASFFGFLACVSAREPFVRYSGLLYAQQRLISELARVDRETAAELTMDRFPGVQRDLRQQWEFWRQYQGPIMTVGSRINDQYLKLHGVHGGIRSYRMSSRLLIAFSRANGGNLVP